MPDIVIISGLETRTDAELMMGYELKAGKLVFFQEKDETTDILSISSAIYLGSSFWFILHNRSRSS